MAHISKCSACFFASVWASTLTRSIKTQKTLGQYPTILISHLVNGQYIRLFPISKKILVGVGSYGIVTKPQHEYIRVTCECIRVHTSNKRVHTSNSDIRVYTSTYEYIQVHTNTSNIRVTVTYEYIRVTVTTSTYEYIQVHTNTSNIRVHTSTYE